AAEVQEDDSFSLKQVVSRVRIGIEEPVPKNRFEGEVPQHFAAGILLRLRGAGEELFEGASLDILRRQDAFGAIFRKDARNPDSRVGLKQPRELGLMGCFLLVVTFLQEALAEFGHEGAPLLPLEQEGAKTVDEVRAAEVSHNRLFDARILDLDRNRLPTREPSPMDLADARR